MNERTKSGGRRLEAPGGRLNQSERVRRGAELCQAILKHHVLGQCYSTIERSCEPNALPMKITMISRLGQDLRLAHCQRF